MYVKTVHLNLLLVHKKVDNTTESLYIIRVKQREDSQMKKLLIALQQLIALMSGSSAIAQTQRIQAKVSRYARKHMLRITSNKYQ